VVGIRLALIIVEVFLHLTLQLDTVSKTYMHSDGVFLGRRFCMRRTGKESEKVSQSHDRNGELMRSDIVVQDTEIS